MKALRFITLALILSLLIPTSALGQPFFYCLSDGSPCAPTCLHEPTPEPCPELLAPSCCGSKSQGAIRSETTKEQRAPLLFAEAAKALDLEISPPALPLQALERTRGSPPLQGPIFLKHCSLLN